jgi:hypothetical protein
MQRMSQERNMKIQDAKCRWKIQGDTGEDTGDGGRSWMGNARKSGIRERSVKERPYRMMRGR